MGSLVCKFAQDILHNNFPQNKILFNYFLYPVLKLGHSMLCNSMGTKRNSHSGFKCISDLKCAIKCLCEWFLTQILQVNEVCLNRATLQIHKSFLYLYRLIEFFALFIFTRFATMFHLCPIKAVYIDWRHRASKIHANATQAKHGS